MAHRLSIIVEKDVPTPMRDGTLLSADIYRPSLPGRYPVLVQRLPYDKSLAAQAHMLIDPLRAASQGYVVVIQDVRGRYASDGDFYPFANEITDGYDTVEWASAQSWANARVGMFGGSYFGATQWLAAIAQPPHLRAIFPSLTASDYHEGWVYRGGALEHGFIIYWILAALAPDTLRRLERAGRNVTQARRLLLEALNDFDRAFSYRPLAGLPYLKELAPYFYEWLEHPENDPFWQRWSIEAQHHKVLVPAYNLGGWYDIFQAGTLRNFAGMRCNGGSEVARQRQRLLMGPWVHGSFLGTVGEVDFGLFSSSAVIDLTAIHLRWFDHWLKEIDNGVDREPPVRIFVMGENIWRNEEEWPLARAQYTNFYFHSGGRANTLKGDGILSTEPPGNQPPDSYAYDPAVPVPTWGGANILPGALANGPRDQRPVEARQDVLVYTSAALTEDLEVTGPVVVHLWAASSALDTDFTAKLVDVAADGNARNLCEGIIRARYRQSREQPHLVSPGEVDEYVIDLGGTSNVFKKGHRIRVEVASSNFPRFHRNPNTGAPLGQDAEFRTATQTVFHDARHPSHIRLPIIPR